MRNPYEVLGVPEGASIDQVKMAYRILSRKYQNDGSADAMRKMDELNAAYDSIVMGSGGSYRNAANDYADIASKIRSGRLDDAQILLDGIPEQSREAQWYYLKGTILQKRGWLEEAANHFATAHRMDPSNNTYKMAYSRVVNARSGGYRTERRQSRSGKDSDCNYCNCCCDLLCADACCECMGGDLISCC